MRVTVVYEDVRLILGVKPNDTVAQLKQLIHSKMVVETIEDKKVGKVLELKFGGASLIDKWVLQDIGIVSGSNIKCSLKTVEKPKLIVYLAYNKETLQITEDIDPLTMQVGEVRSLLSTKLGMPVSVFRLSVNSEKTTSGSRKSSAGLLRSRGPMRAKELYDMNTLDYYGIEIGSKLTLDLWDGWNELIMSAIAGYEKLVEKYFSWERPVRYFQQRVALYIAAFYGHMGLATKMMKRGAKGHEPVGIHPFRKWCFESEHPETQRCPLHVSCIKGQLAILRLFVKSSPLCFVTKNEKGKTPFQITLQHKHRSCFEFLIARQWGRKTCDCSSFSMTIYCRILQWCERAKIRTLLMHGTQKSTYKGHLQKAGALVGTSILVDGYSEKPANSVPFSMIPKPPVQPEGVIFAFSLTKRKLRTIRRRRSSTRITSRRSSAVSTVADTRRERNSSARSAFSSTSTVSFDLQSTVNSGNLFTDTSKYTSQLRSNGNSRIIKKPVLFSKTAMHSSALNKNNKNENISRLKSINSFSQLDAISEKRTRKGDQDPLLSSFASTARLVDYNVTSVKNPKISFKQDLSPEWRRSSREFTSFASIREPRPRPTSHVKKPAAPFVIKLPEYSIPLPPKRIDSDLKPFFYWSPYEKAENPVDETMLKFRTYRGSTPRQNAVQCLTVTSTFTEKPWLKQLRMAVSLTKRGVRKSFDIKPDVLTTNV